MLKSNFPIRCTVLEIVQNLNNAQVPETPLKHYGDITFWKNMRKLGVGVAKFYGG
jgi:hypothetical protein